MEAFYTIIKIAPNPVSGDNISIGLLLQDANKFWLHFSDEKKLIAKRLLGREDTIDFITRQIELRVEEANNSFSENTLFHIKNFLSSDEVSRLSTYFNGILRFSEPSFLNDTITEEKFIKLFKLLIDKTYQKEKPQPDNKEIEFREMIQSKLIERVQTIVHTNIELTPEKLPGLYYNFNVDCIGLNGAFVGAKAIPFHKKYETIDKELSHYFGLISLLNLKYSDRNSREDNYFVIGDEPAEVNSKEHKIWENIRSNPAITLIHSEEADKVADKIEETKATTFLKNYSL